MRIQAFIDGAPVPNGTFALRPDGRVYGLVTGLKVGDNVLTVRVPGTTTSIVITNHPIGGPVFAGAQLQPWICATMVPQTVTVTGNPGSTPPTATPCGSQRHPVPREDARRVTVPVRTRASIGDGRYASSRPAPRVRSKSVRDAA